MLRQPPEPQDWPPPPTSRPPQSPPQNVADRRGVAIGGAAIAAMMLLSCWQVLMLCSGQWPLLRALPRINFPQFYVGGRLFLIVNWFVLPFLVIAIMGVSVSLYDLRRGLTAQNKRQMMLAVLGLLLNLIPLVLWRLCILCHRAGMKHPDKPACHRPGNVIYHTCVVVGNGLPAPTK